MQLVMIRIDDRLIHGQVVVGWGSVLVPDRILLASDEVASVDWQRTIYLSAVPDHIQASVLNIQDTISSFQSNEFDDERVLLLVDSPKSIVTLVENGIEIKEVNVGGMHFKPGKNQIAPYIFVDENDVENFKILADMGISLEGRDVPTRTPIDVSNALNI